MREQNDERSRGEIKRSEREGAKGRERGRINRKGRNCNTGKYYRMERRNCTDIITCVTNL